MTKNQWQCRDGGCIRFDSKCDGAVDCQDGSDETYPLCKNSTCQSNHFRCAYGACVDGTAPCNGVQECADNSDEELGRCFNETKVVRGKFTCDNKQQIPATDLCDGAPNCGDGSDETLRACADITCVGYAFKCSYGACVDKGSDCDGKQDCADNSDESDELCNRTSVTPVKPTNTTPATNTNTTKENTGACVLPPYPGNGRYVVEGDPFAEPGKRYNVVYIKVECDFGYAVNGNNDAFCINGIGFEKIPQCSRFCELHPHPSVDYSCITYTNSSQTARPCNEREFPGTKVVPKCKAPNYRGTVSNMLCKPNGAWSHIAKCSAVCGKITPEGQEYVINGRRAKHGELPWHTGIYKKSKTPYMQVCGGSLVTTTAVITAAHCFWDDTEGKRPASLYAVALGKVYRPWNDTHDKDAQYSDIVEINMPPQFRGASNNFQSDIAVVVLETEIVYQTFIRPVCIDFEHSLNSRQLQPEKLGTIAGWGLNAANGLPSQVLQVVELPYVPFDQCYNESPSTFREYITADKFCAGFLNGTALCEGDSGGGLAFPDSDKFYLRGIVSTAPRNDDRCDPNARTTFTEISKHEHFIMDYINFDL
ncbi:modular serine protease-like [Epargyreus clarus]|uniref:modular serine protease-like n=1 Tax=Epargyreus clarus TaxID=520877 RepID=UPI003C2D2A07